MPIPTYFHMGFRLRLTFAYKFQAIQRHYVYTHKCYGGTKRNVDVPKCILWYALGCYIKCQIAICKTSNDGLSGYTIFFHNVCILQCPGGWKINLNMCESLVALKSKMRV